MGGRRSAKSVHSGERGKTMKSVQLTVAGLPWDQFDPERLDPDTLKVVKAAALVEYAAGKYERYLCNVFFDDPDFQQAARDWAVEEVRHGEALGSYAERADPSFSLAQAYARFDAGYGF